MTPTLTLAAALAAAPTATASDWWTRAAAYVIEWAHHGMTGYASIVGVWTP